jgi:hypothetical protein
VLNAKKCSIALARKSVNQGKRTLEEKNFLFIVPKTHVLFNPNVVAIVKKKQHVVISYVDAMLNVMRDAGTAKYPRKYPKSYQMFPLKRLKIIPQLS